MRASVPSTVFPDQAKGEAHTGSIDEERTCEDLHLQCVRWHQREAAERQHEHARRPAKIDGHVIFSCSPRKHGTMPAKMITILNLNNSDEII